VSIVWSLLIHHEFNSPFGIKPRTPECDSASCLINHNSHLAYALLWQTVLFTFTVQYQCCVCFYSKTALLMPLLRLRCGSVDKWVKLQERINIGCDFFLHGSFNILWWWQNTLSWHDSEFTVHVNEWPCRRNISF
jgi:hypothetical protein